MAPQVTIWSYRRYRRRLTLFLLAITLAGQTESKLLDADKIAEGSLADDVSHECTFTLRPATTREC